MKNSKGKIVGLQIGGTVGPNDRVGMYVPIPIKPGVGVKVELGEDLNNAAKEVATSIPDDHPKAPEIRQIVAEILTEKSEESKIKKAHTLVMIGAGITQVAVGVTKITKLLGF